jgi:hypothetical protein
MMRFIFSAKFYNRRTDFQDEHMTKTASPDDASIQPGISRRTMTAFIDSCDLASRDLLLRPFLRKGFRASSSYFLVVDLITLLGLAVISAVLLTPTTALESALQASLVCVVVLSAAALNVYVKPYEPSQRWRLPVRVTAFVLMALATITNAVGRAAATDAQSTAAQVVMPLSWLCLVASVILIVVLIGGFFATIVKGAEKERQKRESTAAIVAPRRARAGVTLRHAAVEDGMLANPLLVTRRSGLVITASSSSPAATTAQTLGDQSLLLPRGVPTGRSSQVLSSVSQYRSVVRPNVNVNKRVLLRLPENQDSTYEDRPPAPRSSLSSLSTAGRLSVSARGFGSASSGAGSPPVPRRLGAVRVSAAEISRFHVLARNSVAPHHHWTPTAVRE